MPKRNKFDLLVQLIFVEKKQLSAWSGGHGGPRCRKHGGYEVI